MCKYMANTSHRELTNNLITLRVKLYFQTSHLDQRGSSKILYIRITDINTVYIIIIIKKNSIYRIEYIMIFLLLSLTD